MKLEDQVIDFYKDMEIVYKPQMEKDRRDAARYRWLRANPAMLLHLKNSEFDAAIDKAMRKSQAVCGVETTADGAGSSPFSPGDPSIFHDAEGRN